MVCTLCRRSAINAVIRSGGKQFNVREGTVLRVPSLQAEPGSQVQIADVLLLIDGDHTTVGSPTVSGAMVVAEVLEHGRGPKVVNFKYKAKVRYRRKRGHRQGFTALKVREILTGGAKPKVAETSSTRRVAAEAPAPAETPTAEAAPAPRRRAARTAPAESAPEAPASTTPRRRRTPAADIAGDTNKE
jgi:large subunit ribosomal protein L21